MFTLVFWIHLAAVGVCGAAIFGNLMMGGQVARTAVSARPDLMAVLDRLSMLGRGALLVALISGPWMVIAKFGGFAGQGPWFHTKMALVMLLTMAIIWTGINSKRAHEGDRVAAGRAPWIGAAAVVLFAGVIYAAVAAFGG